MHARAPCEHTQCSQSHSQLKKKANEGNYNDYCQAKIVGHRDRSDDIEGFSRRWRCGEKGKGNVYMVVRA